MTDIELIKQYFDIWNDKPIATVLCMLQSKGYKMRDVRRAFYEWCEEV